MSAPALLFSYGTLQLERVQHALFGRSLEGTSDTLAGYVIRTIATRDPDAVATSGVAHHLALFPGNGPAIDGIAYEVSDAELGVADSYEGADYDRTAVTLGSGRRGWVYVAA